MPDFDCDFGSKPFAAHRFHSMHSDLVPYDFSILFNRKLSHAAHCISFTAYSINTATFPTFMHWAFLFDEIEKISDIVDACNLRRGRRPRMRIFDLRIPLNSSKTSTYRTNPVTLFNRMICVCRRTKTSTNFGSCQKKKTLLIR